MHALTILSTVLLAATSVAALPADAPASTQPATPAASVVADLIAAGPNPVNATKPAVNIGKEQHTNSTISHPGKQQTDTTPKTTNHFSRVLLYKDGLCADSGPSSPFKASTDKGVNNSCQGFKDVNQEVQAVSVTGVGCKTYYFSDEYCSKNVFGENNWVPDSGCYTGVGSVKMVC